jgi:hypothetical protein
LRGFQIARKEAARFWALWMMGETISNQKRALIDL